MISRGLVRNNILRSGDGLIGTGLLKAGPGADLRAAHHNWIWVTQSPQAQQAQKDQQLYRDLSSGIERVVSDSTALQQERGFGENFDQRDGNPDPMLGGIRSGAMQPSLAEDSPCIDAGSTEGAPSDDFEGQARNDGKPDIGPDER